MTAREPAGEPLVLRSRLPAEAAGSLLADWLATRFRYLDRAQWQQELAAGQVHLDGRVARGCELLRAGQELAWHKVHREPFAELTVPVLHEDADLLVVDKPAHLPMHADGPFVQNTLVQVLRQRLQVPTLDLVHRLDRETSGVLVLAKSARATKSLLAQFAAHSVQKNYLAVVRGLVAADGAIDAAIGHSSTSSIALRRAVGPTARDAKSAHTQFTVVQRGPSATLLRCVPRTGRTHQIRVHLESVDHPILGDKLYGVPDADYLAFVHAVKEHGDARRVPADRPHRQLLHAESLAFLHPATGAAVAFTVPAPALFAEWLQRPAAGPMPGTSSSG